MRLQDLLKIRLSMFIKSISHTIIYFFNFFKTALKLLYCVYRCWTSLEMIFMDFVLNFYYFIFIGLHWQVDNICWFDSRRKWWSIETSITVSTYSESVLLLWLLFQKKCFCHNTQSKTLNKASF